MMKKTNLFVIALLTILATFANPFEGKAASCPDYTVHSGGNTFLDASYDNGSAKWVLEPDSGPDQGTYLIEYGAHGDMIHYYKFSIGGCSSYAGWWGVYAYLNNYDFTNTKATYYWDFGSTRRNIGTLNQKTAPGGWNKISTQLINTSSPIFGVSSNGPSGTNTGSDGMKLVD
ncbi:hypothetical protein ACFRCQ_22845 [Cytobacillus firmus]|nr:MULTISPECIES: hypothetical protein [Cytobacillus]